jgi:hypothetical protein
MLSPNQIPSAKAVVQTCIAASWFAFGHLTALIERDGFGHFLGYTLQGFIFFGLGMMMMAVMFLAAGMDR